MKGGENAPARRFTYMSSLKNNNRRHVCGAVLIDAKWAVTAAHCVHPEVANAVTFNAVIAVGAHKITDDDGTPGVELIKIAKIYRHENYKPYEEVRGWDIALLELATPSSLTPAPLPNSDHVPSGKVLALGWGTDSRTLQQIFLDIKSEKDCKSAYSNLGPNIVCALNDMGDTCKGDSGGPILIPDSPDRSISAGRSNLDALIGLTSFGNPDCTAFTEPAGYTLIAPHLEWMKGIMKVRPRWDPTAVIFEVFSKGRYTCQGVLIHPQWVASAGHCFQQGKESIEVKRIGSSNSEKMVGDVFIHPDFKIGENDVGLIKLPTRQDGILLPKLPGSTSQSLKGQELSTLMYENEKKKVHSVRMEYMETDKCTFLGSSDAAICAGAFNSLLCLFGTSGAPLLHEQDDGTPIFVGILNSGPSCTTASSTILLNYQGVSFVVNWMKQRIYDS